MVAHAFEEPVGAAPDAFANADQSVPDTAAEFFIAHSEAVVALAAAAADVPTQ